jgi:hypothetical protein
MKTIRLSGDGRAGHFNGAGGTPVRNPMVFLVRPTVRVVRASVLLVAVPAGLLVLGAGAGFAQGAESTARAETTATFGLLGPVGLAAVALGIVGMAAGVLRQRRKARTAAFAAEPAVTDVAAMAEAVLVDEPTRMASAPAPRRQSLTGVVDPR